jgi:homoserine dehydrogenase
MTGTLRLGVAGLGTVGAGVLTFLQGSPAFAPGGARVEVTAVSARSRNRPRPVDISAMAWFDDPVELARSPDIDVFVELIGGSDGPAKVAVETALKLGKPVVTANKALVAEHGADLARIAEAAGAQLLFEAAVMGGAPAVKMLRESLLGERISSLAGILNGTCNYILSEMESSGRDFAAVLADAQRMGYAEADPTMDVGGFDAGHKISILAALAYGGAPDFSGATIEGIDTVQILDIRMAYDLGYRIRLIASAIRDGEATLVRVRPTLVPKDHPLGLTIGPTNALFVEGSRIGRLFLQGPGAGAGPTAAAVVADIADVLANARRPVFQKPATELSVTRTSSETTSKHRAYVRVRLKDEPGAIASVSEILADSGVSIDSLLQKPAGGGAGVPIVLITHEASEAALRSVVSSMETLSTVVEPPQMFFLADVS